MFWLWLKASLGVCLFWLSVDLLYLYYQGQWYDSVALIEWAEVIALNGLAAFGLAWSIVQVTGEVNAT